MKATIYAVICYRRQVVTRLRQRRLCGMTEAFLPLPIVSLQLSIEIHENETQERKCRVHVQVIASVVTYLPSNIYIHFIHHSSDSRESSSSAPLQSSNNFIDASYNIAGRIMYAKLQQPDQHFSPRFNNPRSASHRTPAMSSSFSASPCIMAPVCQAKSSRVR
jgi:hypothetical protein